MDDQRRNIVVVASQHARISPNGPFLRFVRDHSDVLKTFSLHCTRGTALSLTSTGIYEADDVVTHLPGSAGGLVELTAMIAREECSVVLLIFDPQDITHDDDLLRVLKRIADRRNMRLVTTVADAVRWARFEATELVNNDAPTVDHKRNILSDQTIALRAHDAGKARLVTFMAENADIIAQHRRILATGRTGWLLKLLFADHSLETLYLSALTDQMPRSAVIKSMKIVEGHDERRDTDPHQRIVALRQRFGLAPHSELADKIQTFPPGLEGGDALLAEEVLKNQCDTVICFHDPDTMGPHTDDAHMLERTCQLQGAHTACLSNLPSARGWATGVRRELSIDVLPPIAEQLRETFGLSEVILVDGPDDSDSKQLGMRLCEAAAGYLFAGTNELVEKGGGRVAVSWGWAMREVLTALTRMGDGGLLERPQLGTARLRWLASLGDLPSRPELNASGIAQELAEFFGGTPSRLDALGFSPKGHRITEEDERRIQQLELADLVLMSAAPWNEQSGLYVRSGWRPGNVFPDFDAACGTIGGVFVDDEGAWVESEWPVIGLDYKMLRTAAHKGSVVLVSGGLGRRMVVRAALRARLASVLVTSTATARWLLSEHSEAWRVSHSRVLIDVTRIVDGQVHALVRSWDPARTFTFPASLLPAPIRASLMGRDLPVFLVAFSDLNANIPSELDFHSFAIAPDLGPADELVELNEAP